MIVSISLKHSADPLLIYPHQLGTTWWFDEFTFTNPSPDVEFLMKDNDLWTNASSRHFAFFYRDQYIFCKC